MAEDGAYDIMPLIEAWKAHGAACVATDSLLGPIKAGTIDPKEGLVYIAAESDTGRVLLREVSAMIRRLGEMCDG